MVVKDTRNIRTGSKSPPERAPLRRLSSLDKNKGVRISPSEKMAAKIFEELEEIHGGGVDKVVVGASNPAAKKISTQNQTQARTPPHYQLPTVNSSKQARVLSKPLNPSPDFVRARRFSLGLDISPGACKYESRDNRRSSLGVKSGGLRSPNTGLKPKPYRAVEKTPVNNNRMKHLGGGEKTQTFKSSSSSDKTPIPRTPLQSVTLKAARATCSSSCKHVVKGGNLTIEPEPRCPYVYCSLNHLHRESPPPLKQFLASRRRLLRTQKSFKWIGLTPVSKGSVDRGDGVEISSVVDTGQDFYVVDHGKDVAEEDDVLVVRSKMDDGLSPSFEDSQIVDCNDYDDGHSTGDALVSELGENHEFNQIEIVEHLVDELNAKAMDELNAKAMDEEPFGAEDECNQIEVVEHLLDELNAKAMDEEPFGAEDECNQIEVLEDLVDELNAKAMDEEPFGAEDEGNQIEIVERLVDELNAKAMDEEPFGAEDERNQIEIVQHLVDELNAKAMDEEPFGAEDKYNQIEIVEHLVDELNAKAMDEESFGADDECNQIETVEHLVDELSAKAMDEEPFEAEDGCNQIEIVEHLVDALNAKAMDEEPFGAEDGYNQIEIVEHLVDALNAKAMDEEPFGAEDECNQIEIVEHLVDALNAKAMDEEPFGAEDDDIKYGAHELGVEACPGDVGDSVEEFAEDESLKNDNHELEVEAAPDVDESTEDFLKDEDGKNGNYEIEHETTDDNSRIKVSRILVDESACETRSDEIELPADNEDVGDGKLEFDVEASASNFYGNDQIDDTQGPCFIQGYTLGPHCSLTAEQDGLPNESFSANNDDISESQDVEALSVVDGGNCKDQLEGFVEDYDQIEETEQRCFIQLHVLGAENSGHTESDSPQVESYSEVNSDVKDGLPEGCDFVSESSERGSISEVSVTDYAEQPAGYVNGQIEDTELRCFIHVNSFGNECNGHTGSDGLPSEVEEEHHITSRSSECGSISQVGASDHIEHASGSVSEHDRIEDSEQRCLIWLHAQVTESSSQAEPNGLPYAPLPDTNSCIKDEIKGDYGFASGNSEDGSAYKIGISNVIEHDNNKSNELDSSSTGNGESKCCLLVDSYGMQCNSQIKFDSAPNNSVVDANANSSSKQYNKEECIPITRDLFDVFDDDYNLTTLFAESSEEINLEIESDLPVQFDSSTKKFSIPSNFDDEIDEALGEFNVSTKFEGEDSHNLTSGDDECVSEIYDNDVEKHYLEWELLENKSPRTSDEYADGHAKDANLAHYTIQSEPGNWDDILFDIDVASNNDAREEYLDICEISLNECGTECKNIKKELKKLRSISEKNENKPYRLKFRRGRVHPFFDQLSEAEKVDLRHQLIEERRASHEWMVDYALTKIVKKLSPFRKRKVELLVEAFETVIPLSKCETDLQHATTASTCRRPIQACN